MPGSECGPFALLGGGGLGDTFSESGSANLRVSCEEFRYSPGSAFAQDGAKLAKEGDAIRGYSVGRFEHASVCGTLDTFGIPTALLSNHGNQDGTFSGGSGKCLPRFGRDQREWDRVCAGTPLLSFGRRVV